MPFGVGCFCTGTGGAGGAGGADAGAGGAGPTGGGLGGRTAAVPAEMDEAGVPLTAMACCGLDECAARGRGGGAVVQQLRRARRSRMVAADWAGRGRAEGARGRMAGRAFLFFSSLSARFLLLGLRAMAGTRMDKAGSGHSLVARQKDRSGFMSAALD